MKPLRIVLFLTLPLLAMGIPSVATGQSAGGAASASVSAGGASTCEIRSGRLYCWGVNKWVDSGQPGDGPPAWSGKLAAISATTGWTSVAIGQIDCGLRAGAVYCWDADYSSGATVTPTRLRAGTGWSSLTVGGQDACATRSGALYCWDADGSDAVAGLPIRVGRADNWSSVSAGTGHVCGLRAAKAWCWGDNSSGQVGLGYGASVDTPQRVGAASGWSSPSVAGSYSCAVRASALYCWGDNQRGQLGLGDTVDRSTPTLVDSGVWKSVSTSDEPYTVNCAIRADGSLWCWGDDDYGQLGDGTHTDAARPRRVGIATGWTKVATATDHACAVNSAKVYCWGDNRNGQVTGTADDLGTTEPTQFGSGSGWTDIATANAYSCGIASGRLYCWGGLPFDTAADHRVGSASDWISVSVTGEFACGLRADHTMWCWGRNYPTQALGSSTEPVQVGSLRWTQVSVSGLGVCAISSGRLYCSSRSGLRGRYENGSGLVRIGAGADWTTVSQAGDSHGCGIRGTALYCGGGRASGQLGDGRSLQVGAPTPVVG